MSRIYERFLTPFTCQATSAIVADTESSGTKTAFSTLSGGNLDGCREAIVEVDITVPPASEAAVTLYVEAVQFDGTGRTNRVNVGYVNIGTAAAKYSVFISNLPEAGDIILYAVGQGFTASAEIRGIYISEV